jgi:hypothetical protein
MMDADQNGVVSKDEFMNFMSLSQTFDRLDINRGGVLKPNELWGMSIPNRVIQQDVRLINHGGGPLNISANAIIISQIDTSPVEVFSPNKMIKCTPACGSRLSYEPPACHGEGRSASGPNPSRSRGRS